jgi:hypothetical protein
LLSENLAALEGNEPPQALPAPAPPTGRALTPLNRTSFEKRESSALANFVTAPFYFPCYG